MKITEVYTQYKIPPNLQMHQLRVAGVAKNIYSNLDIEVDCYSIASACLLHDMGNILKFDFSKFPQFLEPEGLEYWQGVKDEYREKYGSNEHEATMKIIRELSVSESVSDIIDGIGFEYLGDLPGKDDLEKKIVKYADMRVAPRKVMPLVERINEGKSRYPSVKRNAEDPTFFDRMLRAGQEIEKEIFTNCSIKPEDITDEVVDKEIEGLKNYEV